MKTAEEYMHLALQEAEKAEKIDEVPIGCVIVRDGEVIAKAHNLKEKNQQVTAHAEMLAIQKALKKTKTMYLNDCDLYVTLEPCMMCIGAINLARVNRLFYGTKDPKGGAVNSLIEVQTIPHIKTYPHQVTAGILQKECSQILSHFFQKKRIEKKKKKVSNTHE